MKLDGRTTCRSPSQLFLTSRRSPLCSHQPSSSLPLNSLIPLRPLCRLFVLLLLRRQHAYYHALSVPLSIVCQLSTTSPTAIQLPVLTTVQQQSLVSPSAVFQRSQHSPALITPPRRTHSFPPVLDLSPAPATYSERQRDVVASIMAGIDYERYRLAAGDAGSHSHGQVHLV